MNEVVRQTWLALRSGAESVVYVKRHGWLRRAILALPPWLTANRVTVIRMLLAAPLLGCLLLGNYGLALACFILAALGDALDGMIAEARNQKTTLGAFLDPLADKIVNLAVLFGLWAVLPWPFHWVTAIIALFGLGNTVGRLIKMKLQTTERPADITAVTASKVKFHLECYGIVLLLISRLAESGWLIWLALALLVASLPFAFFSLRAQLPRWR